MATLQLVRLTKRFRNGIIAVSDFDLDVRDGEMLVIVGPSGCGKTTVLRLIAGLEVPTRGDVVLDGQNVTSRPARDRDVAMVFQDYALYPHMSVRENMSFGPRMRKVSDPEAMKRINHVAEIVGLDGHLDKLPGQLSGGQQQRVAFARALVRRPRLFLFDEPLSQLDANFRTEMREEIVRIRKHVTTTAVYVTHDQAEAMLLGDRIVVMRDGTAEQIGSPEEVYARPTNLFVASFVGTPPMSLLPGHLNDGTFSAVGGESKLVCQAPDGEATLGVRGEDFLVDATLPSLARGVVDGRDNLGHTVIIWVATPSGRLHARVPAGNVCQIGDSVALAVRPDSAHFFDCRGRRIENVC